MSTIKCPFCGLEMIHSDQNKELICSSCHRPFIHHKTPPPLPSRVTYPAFAVKLALKIVGVITLTIVILFSATELWKTARWADDNFRPSKMDAVHKMVNQIISKNLDASTWEEVDYQYKKTIGKGIAYLVRVKVRSKSKYGGQELTDWIIEFNSDPTLIKAGESYSYVIHQRGSFEYLHYVAAMQESK